ncbi:ArsR family transcriptional regulator [candidate division WWE3 bacterium]|jgi:DNA-binding transcriptional ArsR family regulator|uniref:ArsR family transcriptional regulator n=1 Tax=candidate division WWE3 bacterium TaxID=2053526 RepID=A0A3A4ZD87_UNCKA|nr:MAG: ArsR family transcriptional regulator [candidate division WWE3 bacterium]
MEIYRFLKDNGKSNVSSIVGAFKLTQPTISYHLKEMRDSGILISKKVGKEVYYSLSGHCPSFSQDCVLNSIEFPA